MNLVAFCQIETGSRQPYEGRLSHTVLWERGGEIPLRDPIENGFFTYADCTKYASTKDCKKYNPLQFKIALWVESTNRSKSIELIQEKGRAKFLAFMEDKKWVFFKVKDTFLNKKYGKKVNEK